MYLHHFREQRWLSPVIVHKVACFKSQSQILAMIAYYWDINVPISIIVIFPFP
ncbi:unnamed protein product [Moneuplotes crassus]|uniref:Uncharacterized protein n=1 Tax=Euplotes crassus TaxID=5936 RepID=A0AAD2D485_EUPCR|nr:unnamed protein product [Moneuplotes crassus]